MGRQQRTKQKTKEEGKKNSNAKGKKIIIEKKLKKCNIQNYNSVAGAHQ